MRQQQGFSFFGIIFLIAILAGITMVAIRVVPPYLDFLTVSGATREAISQPRASLQNNETLMKKIANQLSINNIRLSELGKDAITLTRKDGTLTAEIDYYVEKQVFTGEDTEISITMHFMTSHEAGAKD